jgi:hypothetical protein
LRSEKRFRVNIAPIIVALSLLLSHLLFISYCFIFKLDYLLFNEKVFTPIQVMIVIGSYALGVLVEFLSRRLGHEFFVDKATYARITEMANGRF